MPVSSYGSSYSFGTNPRLLIATGGKPRSLPGIDLSSHVSTFRTLEDFKHLETLTKLVKDVMIIGGGFLASELAASIAARGKEDNENKMECCCTSQ